MNRENVRIWTAAVFGLCASAARRVSVEQKMDSRTEANRGRYGPHRTFGYLASFGPNARALRAVRLSTRAGSALFVCTYHLASVFYRG